MQFVDSVALVCGDGSEEARTLGKLSPLRAEYYNLVSDATCFLIHSGNDTSAS